MAKSYVKALYNYHSNEAADLKFSAGDVIHVINEIDENWIKGEHNGNIGLFPANFVEPVAATAGNEKEVSASSIVTPVLSGKTVVANDTFISGDDGVLTFFRGDELRFLGRVDEYWCQGSLGNEVGLFPAHMVDGLDNNLPPPQIFNSAKTIPNITDPRQPTTQAAMPALAQSHVNEDHSSEPHAKTLFEFKGLSEFELSFPEGQIIILTKDIDAEWFEGTYDGNAGIFPKSFVEVLKPLPKGGPLSENQTSAKSEVEPEVPPYAITIYPFVGETSSELSFREGETIFLHHWVSPEWIQGECNGRIGIFPSTFVQIEKGLPQDFEELSGGATHVGEGTIFGGEGVPPSTQEEEVYSGFETGDKALAIYAYATNMEGDLRLEVGDVVWIEQIIDEEWVLGRKDDNVGLCPAVFLELPSNELELKSSEPNIDKNMFSGGKLNSQRAANGSVNTISVTNPVSVTLNPNDVSPRINVAATTPEIQLIPASPVSLNPPKKTTPPSIQAAPSTRTKAKKPTTLSLSTKPPLAPKPLVSPKPDFLKKPVKPVSSPVKPALPPKPVTPSEKRFSKPNGNCFASLKIGLAAK